MRNTTTDQMSLERPEKHRISLEEAREHAKLTQAQTCRMLGVPLSSLIKWERGERVPSVDKAIELAHLYKLKLDDINFCRSNGKA